MLTERDRNILIDKLFDLVELSLPKRENRQREIGSCRGKAIFERLIYFS
jgi:hypothetical protein